MGVRILFDSESNQACLYCSTTMQAFGPVFTAQNPTEHTEVDAYEVAERFLGWCPRDPRSLADDELDAYYGEFMATAAWCFTPEEFAGVED